MEERIHEQLAKLSKVLYMGVSTNNAKNITARLLDIYQKLYRIGIGQKLEYRENLNYLRQRHMKRFPVWKRKDLGLW